MKKHIAVDLGAESGRIIVGDISSIDTVHRFANMPVRIHDSIYWDILSIFREIKNGLKKAFSRYPGQIVSMGIETWGVDYALLDSQGDLLGNPYHYRDSRNDTMPEIFFQTVPMEEVYRETGIQIMQINTLYQLLAHNRSKPGVVEQARYFVTTPDLLNYWFTGNIKNEYAIASTTQLFNMREKRWSRSLIKAVGVNPAIFGEIVMPGESLGPLQPHIREEVGAPDTFTVIAPGCHDTACAVTAVPAAANKRYAYLSSGTWSLLGIEADNPIIHEKSREYNFTNEGAADGGVRFLKNIMGLWVVQECKRAWSEAGKEMDYNELTRLAEENGPASFSVDVDDPRFLKPGVVDDPMPRRIQTYCREAGQPVPETPGEIVRGVLESLAAKYAKTIAMIEDISDEKVEVLHIIGGGSRNTLLSRLTARECGIPVYTGPVEATAIGNIMVQAIAAGSIDSIREGRELVRRSYPIETYNPA
jgi:rhamnulokinase